MTISYTNLPPNTSVKNLGEKELINYFTNPLELNAGVLDAMVGFFTSRGFDKTVSESLATVLIYQAKKDNFNPLELTDTLKGYNSLELNSLIAEIVNYNRYKTSFLGFNTTLSTNSEVNRNVLP